LRQPHRWVPRVLIQILATGFSMVTKQSPSHLSHDWTRAKTDLTQQAPSQVNSRDDFSMWKLDRTHQVNADRTHQVNTDLTQTGWRQHASAAVGCGPCASDLLRPRAFKRWPNAPVRDQATPSVKSSPSALCTPLKTIDQTQGPALGQPDTGIRLVHLRLLFNF
jgi:hypothetical protein